VPVSRETGSPSSEALTALFPGREEAIHRYVDLLIHRGVDRGLIGPREVSRVWDRHIVNCAVLRDLFPAQCSLADVGSGAGLPGIVLALSRTDLRVTLIEPLLRRAQFLSEVVDELELMWVEVIRARAEEVAGERSFDVVTARAVAPLTRLVPWALPLCRAGGELVALKGKSAAEEVTSAADTLRRFGAADVRIEQWGAEWVETPTTVVRIRSSGYAPRRGKGGR
jgi:16S rRNA (guanine527-N7)-methyltransferase